MLTESGRILVIDDDPQIRRVLKTILVAQGYEVWVARNGSEALDLIRFEMFDLVLLDINLPDMPGTTVCREIRAAAADAIIVALTVRSSEKDKLAAFDAGADDFITKPFDTGELLARIRAHLRGKREAAPARIEADDLVIDFADRTVMRPGNQVERLRLSPKQWQLLRYLASHRGKPLSHRCLLQAVWGPDYAEETMLLQALVARLRKKIEIDPNQPKHIATVPWFGYRFD